MKSSTENNTVKLLRECDAGTKMGISSIEDIIDNVENVELKNILLECRAKHKQIETEISEALCEHNDEGKEPNPMAKGMSWIKTNVKIMASPEDSTIAELMTDGCNMGIKALNKYLNEYADADNRAKSIAEKLIRTEEKLADDIRDFL